MLTITPPSFPIGARFARRGTRRGRRRRSSSRSPRRQLERGLRRRQAGVVDEYVEAASARPPRRRGAPGPRFGGVARLLVELAAARRSARGVLVALVRREAERETVARAGARRFARPMPLLAPVTRCDSHGEVSPTQRWENHSRRRGGVSSSAGAGWPFSRRRRSISSDAAAPEGGGTPPPVARRAPRPGRRPGGRSASVPEPGGSFHEAHGSRRPGDRRVPTLQRKSAEASRRVLRRLTSPLRASPAGQARRRAVLGARRV